MVMLISRGEYTRSPIVGEIIGGILGNSPMIDAELGQSVEPLE
jgi:hypothetical protein